MRVSNRMKTIAGHSDNLFKKKENNIDTINAIRLEQSL